MAADTNVVPLRPVSLLALLENAEASGLTDEQIGRRLLIHFPEWLEPFPGWEPTPTTIRRAVDIPRRRPRGK